MSCPACGICSVSQSVAAARALADAAGLVPPPNGRIATDLMLATENLADHLTHFYLFFMPDFARPAYAGRLVAGLNGTPALFQLDAIQLRVGPVLGPHAAHITRRTGAQAVIRAAAPVVDVVFTGVGRNGWVV